MDTDIEEAAYNATKRKEDGRPEMKRHGSPSFRIKNVMDVIHNSVRQAGRILAIDFFFQRVTHDFDRCRLTAPDFQRFGALIKQHAKTVSGSASYRSCRL